MMDPLASLEATGFASWLRESGSIWAYPAVRAIAAVSIVSCFFVIYWGRMLPFVGNAF
jgi:hypothetical protein